MVDCLHPSHFKFPEQRGRAIVSDPEAVIRKAIRHRDSCPAAASVFPGECVCGRDAALAALDVLVAEARGDSPGYYTPEGQRRHALAIIPRWVECGFPPWGCQWCRGAEYGPSGEPCPECHGRSDLVEPPAEALMVRDAFDAVVAERDEARLGEGSGSSAAGSGQSALGGESPSVRADAQRSVGERQGRQPEPSPSVLSDRVREAFLYVAPVHASVVRDAEKALAAIEYRADQHLQKWVESDAAALEARVAVLEGEVAMLQDTLAIVGDDLDNARSDAAEMASECGKAKMQVRVLEAALTEAKMTIRRAMMRYGHPMDEHTLICGCVSCEGIRAIDAALSAGCVPACKRCNDSGVVASVDGEAMDCQDCEAGCVPASEKEEQ